MLGHYLINLYVLFFVCFILSFILLINVFFAELCSCFCQYIILLLLLLLLLLHLNTESHKHIKQLCLLFYNVVNCDLLH